MALNQGISATYGSLCMLAVGWPRLLVRHKRQALTGFLPGIIVVLVLRFNMRQAHFTCNRT